MPDVVLEAKFAKYVGKAVGPAEVARDPVLERNRVADDAVARTPGTQHDEAAGIERPDEQLIDPARVRRVEVVDFTRERARGHQVDEDVDPQAALDAGDETLERHVGGVGRVGVGHVQRVAGRQAQADGEHQNQAQEPASAGKKGISVHGFNRVFSRFNGNV